MTMLAVTLRRNRRSSIMTFLLVLLLLGASAATRAAEFVGGPYLCHPRMDGMTVGWVADAAQAGEVEYGETEAYGKKAAITLCDQIVLATNVSSRRSACRVRLRGLTPGVTYHYKVSGHGMNGEKTGQFRIPPRTDPLLIVFQGDEYAITDLDVQFVEERVGRPVDLLVDVGDTIQHGRAFYDFKPQLYRRIPIVTAKGNHDSDWSDKLASLHHFDYEGRTEIKPEQVVDYGAARWIVGPYVKYSDDFTREQLTWIEDQLKNTDQAWKFYVCHHIFFSDGYHSTLRWGNPPEGQLRRRTVWPLFMKYNLRIAFNGHDHVYQRTFPIDQDGNKTPEGTVNLDPSIGNSARAQQSPWMARFQRSGDDRANRVKGVTYLYLKGAQGQVEFHTRPQENARLEDFKLLDRFTFSPTRFNPDALVPPETPGGAEQARTPQP
ncbi:MAG: metallophosphoesterase family protein [Kiritimatiellaeota bacterium]|nr:metallophosphoesterase family protein [Kiritimatiellota bacterium]